MVYVHGRFMLEDLPEEVSFLPPGQPPPVGPQPRRLFVVKVGCFALPAVLVQRHSNRVNSTSGIYLVVPRFHHGS